jgi:rubrerythrin
MFSRLFDPGRRDFSTLSEREVLALAISSEEEDGRIYGELASRLEAGYPGTAAVLAGMAEEESDHRRRLLDLHVEKFGPRLSPIRREHVRGFLARKPVWLMRTLSVAAARQLVWEMEEGASRFYREAARQSTDAALRKLFGDLAEDERRHVDTANRLDAEALGPEGRGREAGEQHRQFVLTYVQPGLAGLMDGSVSTLAPVFAAAFATGDTGQTFLVGLAAAVGAGISMGFTEAASDDGRLTGRGSPIRRGIASGMPCPISSTISGPPPPLPPSSWWWNCGPSPTSRTGTCRPPSGARRCRWWSAGRWCSGPASSSAAHDAPLRPRRRRRRHRL